MMRSVDFSKNGEVTAQAASASIDKYCADNGIINKMDAHDGMATMDSYVPKNDVGITVPGSKSTQKFQTTYMNALESEKHTIVLKLLGETEDNKPVLKPVTTKHKPKCVTCGKQNKATAKFCTECGTALEIFA
jgi:membrane protease subunit (stomatin/prohibitin family)